MLSDSQIQANDKCNVSEIQAHDHSIKYNEIQAHDHSIKIHSTHDHNINIQALDHSIKTSS